MKRSVAARVRRRRRRGRRQQDEHVDVGIREELAAAVAADRDQRGVRRACRASRQSSSRVRSTSRARARTRRSAPRAVGRAARKRAQTRRLAPRESAPAARPALAQRRRAARTGVAGADGASGARTDRACAPDASVQPALTKAGGGGDPGRERHHFVAGLGDEHRVLPLRRERAVARDDGPAVAGFADVALAGVDHRLDRERHAGLQLVERAGLAVVQHLRVLVEALADAVAAELAHDREAVGSR